MSTIIVKGLGGPLLLTKGYGPAVPASGEWPPAVDPRRAYTILLDAPLPFTTADPRQAYLLPPSPTRG